MEVLLPLKRLALQKGKRKKENENLEN